MADAQNRNKDLSPKAVSSVRTNMAKKRKWLWLKKTYPLYLLLLPGVVYILIFRYQPMYGASIAFKYYRLKDGILGSEWVGLKWFEKFVNYYHFWTLVGNTLRISIYSIIAGMAVGICLALMMNCMRSKTGKNIVQTVTYMPHFVSTVVVVGIVIRFLNPNSGAIAKLFGISRDLMGVPSALPHIYVWSGIWQNGGWSTILYLSALTAVDPQLHEAALVDGATRFQRVIHIDIPAIVPTIVISLIMSVGGILSVGADKMLLLQNNLNLSTTQIISTYVYDLGIASASPQYSYATAIGLMNSLLTFFLIVIVNQICKKLSGTSLF